MLLLELQVPQRISEKTNGSIEAKERKKKWFIFPPHFINRVHEEYHIFIFAIGSFPIKKIINGEKSM